MLISKTFTWITGPLARGLPHKQLSPHADLVAQSFNMSFAGNLGHRTFL
jgi:hypothetical protein